MANDSKLGILITAKDNASGVLKQVDANVAGFNSSLLGLTKGAGLAAVAMGAIKAAVAGFELARQAAMVDEIRVAYEDLAQGVGSSGDAMLASISAAAKGTVSQQALMLAANKAMLLGVADTTAEMGALMKVAMARGNALGLSTEEAFSDIITGIGRMSPLILDNLGIVANADTVFDDYAASVGKTASQLTDAEKKQVLVNLAISSSADLTANLAAQGDTAAEKFQRFSASVDNAKVQLGAMFGPAMAAIAENLAKAVEGVAEAVENTVDARQFETLREALRESGTEVQSLKGEIDGLHIIQQQLADTSRDLNQIPLGTWAMEMPDAVRENRAAMSEWVTAQIEARREAIALQGTVQNLEIQLYNMRDATESTVVALGHLRTKALHAKGGIDETIVSLQHFATVAANATAFAGEKMSAFADLAEQAKKAAGGVFRGLEGVSVADKLAGWDAVNERIDAARALAVKFNWTEEQLDFTLAEIVNETREHNKELGKTATAVAGVSDQYDALRSKVEGVLSGALDPGVGVNPADFLPREDAVNEDARRLADVAVNGFSSPWYEYLQNKFPGLFDEAMAASGGNVQQAAARLLQDFQDGLNPELIDKEAAKERIKRMLLGDANMKALAEEITAELNAEMGGQFSEAQIAQATAAGLGTGTVEEGVQGTGTRAVDAVVGEIAGAADAIQTSGKQAGANWGNGFLATVGENIPGRLIDILVAIVTPAVWARIQAMGGMTGAEGGT